MIVTMIDGMDAVEACYAFAGIVGIRPHGLTLCQLWKMANGKLKAMRYHQLGQASMVWGLGNADPIVYAEYGQMTDSKVGKPLEHDAETQAKIDAEVARIYADNPHLRDRVKYGKG